jgi:hypothetical protein
MVPNIEGTPCVSSLCHNTSARSTISYFRDLTVFRRAHGQDRGHYDFGADLQQDPNLLSMHYTVVGSSSDLKGCLVCRRADQVTLTRTAPSKPPTRRRSY